MLYIKYNPLLQKKKVSEGQKNELLKKDLCICHIFITADAKNSMLIVHGSIYLTLNFGGRQRFIIKVLLVLFPSC